jgi:hypothetical protein
MMFSSRAKCHNPLRLSFPFHLQELDQIIEVLDPQRDGKIHFEDFCVGVQKVFELNGKWNLCTMNLGWLLYSRNICHVCAIECSPLALWTRATYLNRRIKCHSAPAQK